jgi:tetratricopeptide (TPR) repeat protein
MSTSSHCTIPVLALCALLGICPDPTMAFGDTEIAAGSGIAVGRDVNNSTLNVYNRDPEALQLLARQLDRSEGDRRAAVAKAEELARQLNLSDVTTQVVVQFLRTLARQPDLKLEQVPAKMAEMTANYIHMQERLAVLSPQDPTAADLARQAEEAGRAGRFEEADRLLEQAEARETAAIDEHRVKAAELRAARGDNAATQLHYADAARHYEAAAAQLPPSVSDTKALYLFMAGNALQTYGYLAAALTDYQASHDIFARLTKADPGNAGWQRDLAVSQNKIGDVQRAQGDLAAALTSYQASLAIRDRLAKADPGNAGWQRDLALSYGRMALVKVQQGERDDALGAFRQGRNIVERLTGISPDSTTLRKDLTWFDNQIVMNNK